MNLPIFPAHPTCRECPLSSLEGVCHVGLPTLYERSLQPSPTTPALLIIGQNPGYEENLHGEAFIGKSGIILRGGPTLCADHFRRLTSEEETQKQQHPYDFNLLTIESLPGAYLDGAYLREKCSIYLTNPVRCWTVGDAKPPWKNVTKRCFPHTLRDLHAICKAHSQAPIILLLVSVTAVEAVTNLLLLGKRISTLSTFFKQNGRSHPIHFNPDSTLSKEPGLTTSTYTLTLFATFHPAAYLREPNYIHAIGGHLDMLHSFLTGQAPCVTVPTRIPPRYPQ